MDASSAGTRVSNGVIVASICGCVVASIYLGGRYWQTGARSCALQAGVFMLLGGLLIPTFWLAPAWRMRLSLSLGAFVAALYLSELYLRTVEAPATVEELAQAMQLPIDMRSKRQVVEDLREAGEDAWPGVQPNLFASLDGLHGPTGRSIYPLGGISGVKTVVCNETGTYMMYVSDEHGFNNSPGLYVPGAVDVVLVGDSFAQGQCMPPGGDPASWLRRAGLRALSLGMGGNGPLIELAALVEYARPLRPPHVLWLFTADNDLADLATQGAASLLRRYVYSDFSQDLLARQSEIDRLLRAYVNAEINVLATSSLWELLTVRQLRNRIRDVLISESADATPPPIFRDVLAKAKDVVSAWGGILHFVYLRDLLNPEQRESYHAAIMEVPASLGISVIDVSPERFVETTISDYYPFDAAARFHFNARGYQRFAQVILEAVPALCPRIGGCTKGGFSEHR